MSKDVAVLQVNVRLNEGGAANVAFDLHNRLQKKPGYSSRYYYGYGKSAKPNPLEGELRAKHISNRLQVAANYFLHKVFNYDPIRPVGFLKKQFLEEVEASDIIHLHVVHSYFLSFSWLIKILIESKKKIVWTLHDHWIVTGRCAFIDGCNNWNNACGSCPTLNNYPPVWFDRSDVIRLKKRDLIMKLAEAGCTFVSPSEHLMSDIRCVYPDIDIQVVHNALDMDTEKILKSTANLKVPSTKNNVIRVMVIAHDLNYRGKTNQDLVNKVKLLSNIEIHTVGKNSPFSGERVINHGYVSTKTDLFKIYQQIDLMLFTSIVDNFPLVIGESLGLGIPVIASNSAAANEILSLVGGRSSKADFEIINALNNENWMECFYANQTLEEVQNKAIQALSGCRLLQEYIHLYEKKNEFQP
jgi:putative colanic acid biosynthesis glycosyltransferase